MFDFRMLTHLGARAFSLNRNSLRYPTPRRVINVLITLPLFLMLIVINRFFMMVDHLLFPGFNNMTLNRCVFITGVPRSATTYAYHLLAGDTVNFTCFRMWELLFAPSITQKYLLAGVLAIDRRIGRPLYRLSLMWDRAFLTPIARLHDTGLSKPEEDEILLLHAFASVYLIFFFPGVPAIEPYLFFDDAVPVAKRNKIMLYYKRCVQRHVYFHDRDENKYFLSKNPSFVSKTSSLAKTFQNARLIYMLRSPEKTIPSTINLNRNIYAIFSGTGESEVLSSHTRDIVVQWYKMADRSIRDHWKDTSITIPFQKITRAPEDTLSALYTFLQLNLEAGIQRTKQADGKQISQQTYARYNDAEMIRQLDFIFQGPFNKEL